MFKYVAKCEHISTANTVAYYFSSFDEIITLQVLKGNWAIFSTFSTFIFTYLLKLENFIMMSFFKVCI